MPKRRPVGKFTRSEILTLFKKSKLLCRYPELDIRAKSSHGFGRLLIITPKKIGNAPNRNKARRRLRAIFYENKLFELGLDIVIFCKPGIKDLGFSKLKEIILKCVELNPLSDPAHTEPRAATASGAASPGGSPDKHRLS